MSISWGDRTPASQAKKLSATLRHTYRKVGLYTVIVTVTDRHHKKFTAKDRIVVHDPVGAKLVKGAVAPKPSAVSALTTASNGNETLTLPSSVKAKVGKPLVINSSASLPKGVVGIVTRVAGSGATRQVTVRPTTLAKAYTSFVVDKTISLRTGAYRLPASTEAAQAHLVTAPGTTVPATPTVPDFNPTGLDGKPASPQLHDFLFTCLAGNVAHELDLDLSGLKIHVDAELTGPPADQYAAVDLTGSYSVTGTFDLSNAQITNCSPQPDAQLSNFLLAPMPGPGSLLLLPLLQVTGGNIQIAFRDVKTLDASQLATGNSAATYSPSAEPPVASTAVVSALNLPAGTTQKFDYQNTMVFALTYPGVPASIGVLYDDRSFTASATGVGQGHVQACLTHQTEDVQQLAFKQNGTPIVRQASSSTSGDVSPQAGCPAPEPATAHLPVPPAQAAATGPGTMPPPGSTPTPAGPVHVPSSWGNDLTGNLGNNTTSSPSTSANTDTPGPVSGLANVVAVTGGDGDGYALTSAGVVYAWGDDSEGEVGDGTAGTQRNTPVAVLLAAPAVAIAASRGGEAAYALLDDGTVESWGDNNDGESGQGSAAPAIAAPARIPGLTGIAQIAAGATTAYALNAANGVVYAWGDNRSGQLGDADTYTQERSPVAVTSAGSLLTGVTAIGAGASDGYAVANGTVYAWGDNTNDQIGTGSSDSDETQAVQITGLAGKSITEVTGGYADGYALAKDTVYAWGDNSLGQIGDGHAEAIQPTPKALTGFGGRIASIAAGYSSAYVLLGTSSLALAAWGDNTYGELGDGTTTIRTSPVLVKTTTVTSFGAGDYTGYAVN